MPYRRWAPAPVLPRSRRARTMLFGPYGPAVGSDAGVDRDYFIGSVAATGPDCPAMDLNLRRICVGPARRRDGRSAEPRGADRRARGHDRAERGTSTSRSRRWAATCGRRAGRADGERRHRRQPARPRLPDDQRAPRAGRRAAIDRRDRRPRAGAGHSSWGSARASANSPAVRPAKTNSSGPRTSRSSSPIDVSTEPPSHQSGHAHRRRPPA